ncbi:MAG: hypothetical protein Q8P05_01090 [Candidatus Diapherotrites archaeon]|nr:hypothetical protein [Candidatus Diapherotrites archaeon]
MPATIGPTGIKRRRSIGLVSLVIAGVLSGYLVAFSFDALARVIVFPFFLVGFISLLEAQKGVCVVQPFQKKTEMD